MPLFRSRKQNKANSDASGTNAGQAPVNPCQNGHALTYAWQTVKDKQVYGLKCCNTSCNHFEAL